MYKMIGIDHCADEKDWYFKKKKKNFLDHIQIILSKYTPNSLWSEIFNKIAKCLFQLHPIIYHHWKGTNIALKEMCIKRTEFFKYRLKVYQSFSNIFKDKMLNIIPKQFYSHFLDN